MLAELSLVSVIDAQIGPQRSRVRRRPASGRDRFAGINAVEGVALTPDMRADLERYDRDGLSAAERRRAIQARFAP